MRRAAPNARLIVDPNESWTLDILRAMQPALKKCAVGLLEQPLPADADDGLQGFSGAVPICADESCHVAADLPRLRERYQAINIKLDKTGGLTEAWRLLHAARAQGFRLMVGCMVGSSLGIAPALEVARAAEYAADTDWQTCGNGQLYAGVDIGRKKDLTVLWVFEKLGDVFRRLGIL